MTLAQHLNTSINSLSCQAGKENKTARGRVFSVCTAYLKICFILDVDQ